MAYGLNSNRNLNDDNNSNISSFLSGGGDVIKIAGWLRRGEGSNAKVIYIFAEAARFLFQRISFIRLIRPFLSNECYKIKFQILIRFSTCDMNRNL